MQPTIVCRVCDERLTEATIAIRRHETVMHDAIELAEDDSLTEELRKDLTDKLWATLEGAQAAWDAYRSHLAEHRLLPSRDAA